MKLINPKISYVLTNPVSFALVVLKAFQANQGLLLAGAVAYYALLSIVPLLILMVILLSQVIDQAVLLATLVRALEYVVPGQARAVVAELKAFLDHREVIGWVLLITMLFFSSLGFKVLESAISVIFLHRVEKRRRHFLVSLLLPFGYIFFIGTVLLAGTFVIVDLVAIGGENLVVLGHSWSLGGFSRWLIYFAGVLGEILLISAIYYFMPVGRLTAQHALIGGATAGLLWEIIRHALGWYFGTLSQVSVVYGSLTTAIIVLLSLEVAATLLLLGAQVIAEYERVDISGVPKAPVPMRTEAS
ncbi:YihY/virulence factor BrkB family protein [Sulfurirhabdus autotrophica]|uniref:YihY family inner membrane protein n=1 Tax=Sulfurirhabdus autotrophica TaxID=1706046 RepID=A0A4R3YEH1_9PROT|nr:YihY/virulence factor BrkB family protein [Sulfurirhabdus autotrophica]TCV90557.1 YihY family inner membrane protein [Sulfurirhabdus autotrophica]